METVCGLDVHKGIILMCILQDNGVKIIEEFSTLTCDIQKMRDIMIKHGVQVVGMESTGVYWIPVWRILQGHFHLKLINPYFIKQLPGRKTDVKDSEWIATVIQKDLVRGSYVPGKHIQELRQFERRYVRLCEQSTRIEQEIDRQLHRCNIQITNYVTKIGSSSVIKVVRAIIKGVTDASELEKSVHGRVRNKHKDKIPASLTGVISPVDRFLLEQSIREYDLILAQQEECLKAMREYCNQYFKKELGLLCTIPGIQELSAMVIIAELGVDLKTFATAAALTGWAGLRPRNDESAKKIKSTKITKGNKYLRRILVQCAWGASRQKGCRFKSKYEQLCVRKSNRKALIAVARKLLVTIWHVLTKKEAYIEQVPKTDPRLHERKLRYYQKKLEQLQVQA